MITKITDNNFKQEVLQAGKRTVLDFYADWCGPCKMLSPILDELEQNHPEWKFCKTDVDESPSLAARFGVLSIPTVAVFEGGELLDTFVGFRSKSEVTEFIQNA